jgi:FlaG/FlaF family flagellin (archaellin)
MGTFVAGRGRSHRALRPVLGAVVLVALTVLLASTLGAYALGVDLGAPGPHVALDAEPVVAYDHDDGDREQRLRLVHGGGTPVPVSELELVVAMPRTGDRARVGGFPVASNTLDPARVDGSGFLDTSHGEAVGSLSLAAPDRDGVWVRVTDSACASTAVRCDSHRATPWSSAWSTQRAGRWWRKRR